MSEISINARKIRQELDAINKDAKIIAATKTRTREEIEECLATGAVAGVGENRVQEFRQKYSPGPRWDFIGRLQTNKVKYVVGKVFLIHSLDRLDLAEAIQRECVKRDLRQNALIEINTMSEPSKGGVSFDDFDAFRAALARFDRISVCGIMAMTALDADASTVRAMFEKARAAFDRCRTDLFCELSMGMSADYALAAECGATIVRPGRAIFGPRRIEARS